jgi:hypothetical protein
MPGLWKKALLALAAACGLTGQAFGQAPQCDAWRAELSRIDRGGGGGNPRAAEQARRVAGQLASAQSQFAGLQCDGAWIFQQPPPQCGALRGQIGQLRAQYASLQQQAGGGGNDARRRALIGAINDHCQRGVFRTEPVVVPQQPAQPRTLFEAIFGVPERAAPQQQEPLFDLPPEERSPREAQWGAGRPVCVRTCDGFFFPLSNAPGGRDGLSGICSALCPAAETEVFFMPGDGNIENAVGRGGRPYTNLANASRYTRQFDASCACRRPGQTWAQALTDAEDMLDSRRGDVFVTERRAAEMSRPRIDARADQRARRAEEQERQRQEAAARQDAQADEQRARALDTQNRATPTAGSETSGIGGDTVGAGTLAAGQGDRREVVRNGETRTVRVVAPNLAPAIQ